MERKEGRGRPGAPTSKEQESGQKENAERQSLPGHDEGRGEPSDLNVSSANTVDAELSEVGKDKPPLKRRCSLAFAGPRSENKKP